MFNSIKFIWKKLIQVYGPIITLERCIVLGITTLVCCIVSLLNLTDWIAYSVIGCTFFGLAICAKLFKARKFEMYVAPDFRAVPKEMLHTLIVFLYSEDNALKQSAGSRICELSPYVTTGDYATWTDENRFLFRKFLHDCTDHNQPLSVQNDVRLIVAQMLLRVGSKEDQRVAKEALGGG